ncbi:MAG: hypothetical protein RI940_319 [Bacteroidota bacterium]|jgi:hypothetical protein
MSLKPHFTKQLYMSNTAIILYYIESNGFEEKYSTNYHKTKRKLIQDIIDTLRMTNTK